MGVGIHGESGRGPNALAPAKDIVAETFAAILGDLAPAKGSEALLFVNGFGATPSMELYLLFKEAAERLAAAGVVVARAGWFLCDVHRHGGRLDHGVAARRGSQAAVGRAGEHRRAALGCVKIRAAVAGSTFPAEALFPEVTSDLIRFPGD